jgi:hypothetical protein
MVWEKYQLLDILSEQPEVLGYGEDKHNGGTRRMYAMPLLPVDMLIRIHWCL